MITVCRREHITNWSQTRFTPLWTWSLHWSCWDNSVSESEVHKLKIWCFFGCFFVLNQVSAASGVQQNAATPELFCGRPHFTCQDIRTVPLRIKPAGTKIHKHKRRNLIMKCPLIIGPISVSPTWPQILLEDRGWSENMLKQRKMDFQKSPGD